MSKVAILGAGFVGTATATYLAERNLADITLIDVIDYGLAAGKAVDLSAAAAVRGFSSIIEGTDKIEALEGAQVVVNTAGVPRKPGMDRMDLLKINAKIAAGFAKSIATHAPDAVVINVTNPLDVLAYIILKGTGFPRGRVMGMAGVLDSTRFRTFIAGALGCDPKYVSAMVLGGHGDTMVPITRTATVSGVPIKELLAEDVIDSIVERTRNAGAEVVKLLRTGSAFSSTGAAVCEMIEPCLTGRPRLLPVCTYLDGEYGIDGICLGVPALIGQGGVQRIIELDLTKDENEALFKSADGVRAGIESLSGEDLG